MSETTPVQVRILGVEHTLKSGNLLGFVSFSVVIHDVELTIQGAQVRKSGRPGEIELRPPEFRSGNGRWLPSVLMDDAIWLSVLSELGTDWPPKPGKLKLMTTTEPPELTLSFAPHLDREKEVRTTIAAQLASSTSAL